MMLMELARQNHHAANCTIWLRGAVAFDAQVSRDEEELAKKRLAVKRGLPLQVYLVCALTMFELSGGCC